VRHIVLSFDAASFSYFWRELRFSSAVSHRVSQTAVVLRPANRRQDGAVSEQELEGGNAGGAVRVGDTVRRATGAWTPSVHAVLHHLDRVGFARAPKPLGIDEGGREVLSFLPGNTVGTSRPWPAWVHSDGALVQVAHWLRDYHVAVANFVPSDDAVWREGGHWQAGLVIGQNDAAPYNAAWDDQGQLAGFFDWDFAAPVSLEWDLAFTAFAWVPLHARHVAGAEGFADFADRPRRLRLFLNQYGWTGEVETFLETVQQRVLASAEGIERTAGRGDAVYQHMLEAGVADSLRIAAAELDRDAADFVSSCR
jgi:hypothetical protein